MKNAAKPEPTSCYFDSEELRTVEEIAEKEERSRAKVVQFAVRAFGRIWREDRERALQLAERTQR